jgi:hypothetical protein
MSATPAPIFRSSGRPGFSSLIQNDPQHVVARKLAREIQVRFAATEGVVNARPGDAIITGISGEHWRVSSSHFSDKYEPVPPTKLGEAGTYRSLRYQVLALKLNEGFEVILADGASRLRGRAGDWLVDYGDGSLGIVSASIFDTTYELVG